MPLTTGADRLNLIHSDEPVVIQLDDDEPDGPGIATSSNSQPSMVARMLRLLSVEDGHRVLEIGTASGYVAALLSRRLGDSAVYSVEVDPGLAHHAVAVLRAAGHRPNLACGDGERGWPDQAPFDRIVATCALREVPHALVRQLTPGGLLVAPMARDFWSGALVRLTADGRGTASGRFHGGASYMPMRSHRPPCAAPVDDTTARPVEAAVDPRAMLSLGFALPAGRPVVSLGPVVRNGRPPRALPVRRAPRGPPCCTGRRTTAEVPMTGRVGKTRNIFLVWLIWPLITLGIYHLVWYYKVNREARDFDERIDVRPGMAVVAIALGWILIVPPFISVYNTGDRIARMQRAAGMTPTCNPWIGLILVFVFSLHTLYYQQELNRIWALHGNRPEGEHVSLAV